MSWDDNIERDRPAGTTPVRRPRPAAPAGEDRTSTSSTVSSAVTAGGSLDDDTLGSDTLPAVTGAGGALDDTLRDGTLPPLTDVDTPPHPTPPHPTVPVVPVLRSADPGSAAPDGGGAAGTGSDPAAPRHAAPRRAGLLRRMVRGVRRGIVGAAMGVVQAGWRFVAWRRTPVGGFAAPLAAALTLVAVAVAAGVAQPHLYPDRPPRVAYPLLPTVSPIASAPATGAQLPRPTQSALRPVDRLTGWATQLSPLVGIPVPALRAYGNAQLAVALTLPSCHLTWTTLAGIGKVESGHGTVNGATLQPDGHVTPKIIGPALDGTGGKLLVRDSDLGHFDGDATFDHAIGPMQFLPASWETYQADGDGDGQRDPSDFNDAAVAAAYYLCANGRDLAKAADWWAGVLAYNPVQAYAQGVFVAADEYGKLSRAPRPAGTASTHS